MSRHKLLGVFLLIAAATLVASSPALHGGFLWDDDGHVTRLELRSWQGLGRIWFDVGATQQYYPLLHTAFWLEHRLWGDAPLGYHLVNIALHLTAAGLAYLVLQRLSIPGAMLAAAIFALHPVHVESVAWISEQKNTLSAVFYLAAMLAYLRFDDTRQRSLYSLALVLFVLGLLSKTVTATLPAALLVVFWWQRGTLAWRRDVVPLVLFFALGAIGGLMTAWFERTLIGAEGAAFELTILERGLLAGRAIWFYLGKLLWPSSLTFIYLRWEVHPAEAWQWMFPLAALAATAVLWRIRSRVRGPLAAWLLFVGTLFPVLGFLNVYPFVYSYVADHFQYLASLAMIVLAATGISLLLARLPERARWAGWLACLVLLGTLATLTWRQSRNYADSATLYQATIDRNPSCWMAYYNLGLLRANQGQPHEAISLFEQALGVRPDYPEAHNNLGVQRDLAGQLQEAILHYETAVRLRPDYQDAHNNLGSALAAVGQFPAAIEHLETAVRLQGDDVVARANLVAAYAGANQTARAVAAAHEALPLARAQRQTAIVDDLETLIQSYPSETPAADSEDKPTAGSQPP